MDQRLSPANDDFPKPGPSLGRRGAERRRVLLTGRMVHGAEQDSTTPCRLRDLSTSGARVVLPEGEACPREGFLIVVKTGQAHEARPVWTEGRETGLRFVGSHNLAGPVAIEALRARELWAELARR